MSKEAFTFDVSGTGSVSAVLIRPAEAKWLYVFAHGAGAGMNHAFMESMATALASEKVATLRYQFPYMEAGRRAPNPKPVLVQTVRSAVGAARDAAPDLPLIAGGKSMGGRMTSSAAAENGLPDVHGLVFLGFPLHAAGRPGTERGAHLKSVGLPMLFVQGTRDRLANLMLLEPLLDDVEPSPAIHIVDDGDHSFNVPKRSLLTHDEVIRSIAGAIASWAERRI